MGLRHQRIRAMHDNFSTRTLESFAIKAVSQISLIACPKTRTTPLLCWSTSGSGPIMIPCLHLPAKLLTTTP